MKTLRNTRKRLKTAAQKQNMFLNCAPSLYNYEDILFARIKRYAY
ncbi:hypothetical protein [Aquimarina algicola]|nr:hypothetical protein [Aquimarina algicola]